MSAADFDVKIMPRDELERELEARRDEYAAASKVLEDAGVPEIVHDGEHSTWRALSLRMKLLVEKNDTQAALVFTLLADHWPTIVCDHERKTDKAQCSCCTYEPPECPSVGAAVQSWIDHVRSLMNVEKVHEKFRKAVNESPAFRQNLIQKATEK